MGIGQLTIDNQRLNFIDYSRSTYPYNAVFFARKPKPVGPFLKILEPLDVFGWTGFLITAIVVIIVVLVVIQCHPHLRTLDVSASSVISK